jgi:dihydroneopterin aldolase
MLEVIEFSDKICLHDIRTKAIVGVLDSERTTPQTIVAHIDIFLDLAPSGASDSLSDTVDYSNVYTLLLREIETSRYLLLEKLAEMCSSVVLDADARILAVKVCLEKPEALANETVAKIEVVRRRFV